MSEQNNQPEIQQESQQQPAQAKQESKQELTDEQFFKNEERKRLEAAGGTVPPEETEIEEPEVTDGHEPEEESEEEVETSEETSEEDSLEEIEDEPIEEKPNKKEQRKKRYEQKKRTYQSRINELTKKIHQQNEEIERLKGEPGDPPVLMDFADDEGNFDKNAYKEAQSKYDKDRFEEYHRQAKEEELERDKANIIREKQELFNLKAEELQEKYEDFESYLDKPILNDSTIEGILNCKEGPEVFYYLAKNDRERAYVNSIANDPMALGMELGRIETKLAGLKKRTSKTLPKPMEPVSGDSGEIVKKELTDEEWFAREEKKRLAKIKTRGY